MLLQNLFLFSLANVLFGSGSAASISAETPKQENEMNVTGSAGGQDAVQGLSSSKFAIVAGARSEAVIYATDVIGFPQGGQPFDDFGFVNKDSGHKRIARVILAGCEPGSHVNLIGFGFRDNFGPGHEPTTYSYHGKQVVGQKLHELYLAKVESIVEIELTTWRAKVGFRKRKTRIGWVKFTTSYGATIECGSKNPNDPIQLINSKRNDASLLYVSGSSGDAVDSMQGHYIDDISW